LAPCTQREELPRSPCFCRFRGSSGEADRGAADLPCPVGLRLIVRDRHWRRGVGNVRLVVLDEPDPPLTVEDHRDLLILEQVGRRELGVLPSVPREPPVALVVP